MTITVDYQTTLYIGIFLAGFCIGNIFQIIIRKW